MGSPAKVSGLLYSKQRVSAVPVISRNAVEISTILLCRVRLLKNLPPFCLRFFITRDTSHHTIYPSPPRIISAAVVKVISALPE